MLTIGQLAASAGVSVRTVRHYHQVGLMPEPERDDSGYRRYGAAAVVDLVRIRTLADAGVPLARVGELLHASSEEFESAVADVDAELRRRLLELQTHRRRVAALRSGDALHLPPEVVANLERLRTLGVGERALQLERDAWILTHAVGDQDYRRRLAEKTASFDDPRTLRLHRAVCEAVDRDPDDGGLDQLIDELERWQVDYERAGGHLDRPEVLSTRLAMETSPALARVFGELARRTARRHERAQNPPEPRNTP